MAGLLIPVLINCGSDFQQQQQQRFVQEQTMSVLLRSLTLGTAERKCFHGTGHALVPLPPNVDNFIYEFEQNMYTSRKNCHNNLIHSQHGRKSWMLCP
jgi:hypothetical protein